MTIEVVETDPGTDAVNVTCVWFVDKTLYRTTLAISALTSAMWPIAT